MAPAHNITSEFARTDDRMLCRAKDTPTALPLSKIIFSAVAPRKTVRFFRDWFLIKAW